MTGPLLRTKLHPPRGRRSPVARPRLLEWLGRGPAPALTLVSAPAGFGKSTLLTEWLAVDRRATGWVSLDRRDNDPAVFWTYAVTALATAAPRVGAVALELLREPGPRFDELLATVLNDLSTVDHDVLLVLDDYHVIDSRTVHDGVAFLLEHRPPQLHLAIAGRTDPPLPLARLRARGELVEVRAGDLRFTPGEAAAYLTGTAGLALSGAEVAALTGRTEGWIAALQLAALSMRDRPDTAGFVAAFAGDDRHVVDYLAEEVLSRQPGTVREFLLRTSILERLCGPLCDAVAGGGVQLAELERANLFLVPLDDRRRWYRYHHLFGDVLRARLLDERPGELPELHRRASRWHAGHGEPGEAVRHALAAGDVDRAADLVELAVPAARRDRREAAIRGWLDAVPDETVRVRPVLTVGFVGALLAVGELDGVEERLRDAERWLANPTPEMVVVDHEGFARLPAAIALYRAALAQARGDVPASAAHARRVLELAAPDDHMSRAAASGLLGLVHWTAGDLEPAHRAWSDCAAGLRRSGHVADTFGCAIAQADIRLAQGRLGDALRTYEQALELALEQAQRYATGPALRGTADMHVGMCEVLRERDDLPAAAAHLHRARELGEHAGLPQNRYRLRVAAARLRAAEGDPAGALELLDEAQRLYDGDLFPEVRPVPAVRARLLVAMGRVDEARRWADERGLSDTDELDYLHEYEHVTLAGVLLAGGADVRAFLDRLLRAAEEGGRTGSVIEILVLLALARQSRDDQPAALSSLHRALALAEPEGHVRVFADAGPPMTTLLTAAGKQADARRLLAAIDRTPTAQGLIDPLSDRELDVLRLLGTDLDGPGIARRLVVSLSTVRTHTSHIYAKLGVNNRRSAVRRAKELGLLTR